MKHNKDKLPEASLLIIKKKASVFLRVWWTVLDIYVRGYLPLAQLKLYQVETL